MGQFSLELTKLPGHLIQIYSKNVGFDTFPDPFSQFGAGGVTLQAVRECPWRHLTGISSSSVCSRTIMYGMDLYGLVWTFIALNVSVCSFMALYIFVQFYIVLHGSV